MIRSSVNLDCFISVSLKVTDSTHFWRKFRGSGHRRFRCESFALAVDFRLFVVVHLLDDRIVAGFAGGLRRGSRRTAGWNRSLVRGRFG